jgi:hypothetical protein
MVRMMPTLHRQNSQGRKLSLQYPLRNQRNHFHNNVNIKQNFIIFSIGPNFRIKLVYHTNVHLLDSEGQPHTMPPPHLNPPNRTQPAQNQR